jgi:putative ABC transport system permease protein
MLLFALKTLVYDRGKLIVALSGVVFSVVLVNIQGGLFLGMIQKASLLVDHCDADIWVAHHGIHSADIPAEIPIAWLNRVRGLPGVREAAPYVVASGPMTLPSGDYEGVWIIGADAETLLGGGWGFTQGSQLDLRRPDGIAVDELDAWKLGNPQVGDVLEINGHRAKIVAKTNGILGFVTAPYVFTTLDNAQRYARMPESHCSFYLVDAADGADLDWLCQEIEEHIPELEAYTAEAFSRRSQVYWATRTGIGMSFGGATVLGLLVGFVMVAQSLYALVLDHLSDYATLKAIGADSHHIYSVLMLQGLTIAGLGSTVGCLVVYALQQLTSTPYAPIEVPPWLMGAGVAIAIVICIFSSLLPLRRLHQVDPAVVLQE